MSKKLLLARYFIYKQFKELNDQYDSYFNSKTGGSIGGKVNIKWTTFTHNGVMFSPPYVPHKIPVLYKGQKIVLKELDGDKPIYKNVGKPITLKKIPNKGLEFSGGNLKLFQTTAD